MKKYWLNKISSFSNDLVACDGALFAAFFIIERIFMMSNSSALKFLFFVLFLLCSFSNFKCVFLDY